MRTRMVPLLLLAGMLAGCVSDDAPADDAGVDEANVITDPTDLDYNGTAGSHIHDYWGGQDRLPILDHSRGTTWNTVGDGWWSIAFFPPDGTVVPQGTSRLEVDVDWTDTVPTNLYSEVSLWAKTPLQNEPAFIQEVTRGDTVSIPVAYEEADLPHQVLSAWEFQVRYNTSDMGASTFFGSAHLEVTAFRGHKLQPFPPHPDHWQNQTTLPLVEDERRFFWNAYTGSGHTPQRIRALEGAMVPPDAQVVTVALTGDNEYPVGGLRLAFHAADTRSLTYLEPDRVEGDTYHYRLPVGDGMADGPYTNESLWEFLVDVESVVPPGQAIFSGDIRLEATVYRDAADVP